MAEIRLKENESPLKVLKKIQESSVPELALLLRFAKEKLMKSPL